MILLFSMFLKPPNATRKKIYTETLREFIIFIAVLYAFMLLIRKQYVADMSYHNPIRRI